MTFTPNICSTPKFIPVLNQPSHFLLATAPKSISSGDYDRQLTTRDPPSSSSSRPLKKCHRFYWKQSNASTAINRQYHFDNDTTIPNNSSHLFFCLPFQLFSRSQRRHRHRPCHV